MDDLFLCTGQFMLDDFVLDSAGGIGALLLRRLDFDNIGLRSGQLLPGPLKVLLQSTRFDLGIRQLAGRFAEYRAGRMI